MLSMPVSTCSQPCATSTLIQLTTITTCRKTVYYKTTTETRLDMTNSGRRLLFTPQQHAHAPTPRTCDVREITYNSHSGQRDPTCHARAAPRKTDFKKKSLCSARGPLMGSLPIAHDGALYCKLTPHLQSPGHGRLGC